MFSKKNTLNQPRILMIYCHLNNYYNSIIFQHLVMSIMPFPYEPQVNRPDHNESSNQINKLQENIIKQQSKQGKCERIRRSVKQSWENTYKIIENIHFQIFITIFTISSLFMEDVRIIFIDKQHDNIIDIINIIFIAIFMVEVIMSISVQGYACSFFFYLDIVSTLSLVMDVSMITNIMYENSSSSGLQLSMIIKNSKATRAAARTVRVMKIFRLARIVKIYKSALKTKQLKAKKMKQQMKQRLEQIKLKKTKLQQKQQQVLASGRNIDSQFQSKGQMNSINTIQPNNNSKKHYTIKQSKNTKTTFKLQRKINEFGTENSKLKQRQSEQTKKQLNVIQESGKAENQQQLQQITSKFSKKQSKISKLLSDSSMKKIIVVILLLMLSVPVLDIDNYYQQTSAWDFLTDFVVAALQNPEISIQKINKIITINIQKNKQLQDNYQVLVAFKTPFNQLYSYDSGDLQNQRVNDLMISQSYIDVSLIQKIRNNSLTLNKSEELDTVSFIFSSRKFNQIDSWFSISKILFICVGIIYLLNIFNQSITQMITQPIQRMLEDVKNNGKVDSFEFQQMNQQGSDKKIGIQSKKNNYQTTNVHFALNKISKLITKIFGVRGKQHIYRKIFQPGTVSTNYLTKSNTKKIYCILGYCTINNYYAISKILKDQVIQLNSEVAQYLHSAAFRYGANGLINYQGSFLVVFQCPAAYQCIIKNKQLKLKKKLKQTKSKYERSIVNLNYLTKSKDKIDKIPNQTENKMKKVQKQEQKHNRQKVKQEENNNYFNVFADFSIYALVKTIVKINKEGKFYKYRKNIRLLKQLGDNFQIKLNCMLHAGWIQEGFLGSNFKMDFCYFGKPITQLKKMAYYSKNLPSHIVLSQNVYEHLTPGLKRYTRIIDKYVSNECQIQNNLYSVDLNLQNISPPKNIFDKKHLDIALVSLKRIFNFENLKDQQQIHNYKASTFINSKKQLKQAMKNVISEQYRRKYEVAYQHYVRGQYQQGKQLLNELSTFNKEDPLVKRLFMLICAVEKGEGVYNG